MKDEDEKYRLFNRRLFFDLPREEQFRSNLRLTNYDDADDFIVFDTLLRQARRDTYDDRPDVRQFEKAILYTDEDDAYNYRDYERGDHVRDHVGQNFGQ